MRVQTIIALTIDLVKVRLSLLYISDAQRMQYLTCHSKPVTSDDLHSHSVTKSGKSWKVKFQLKWLNEFPWLSYSGLLRGGISRCCILFTEGPKRGGSRGSLPGVIVLSPYQYPYNKALGKEVLLMQKMQFMCRLIMRNGQIFFAKTIGTLKHALIPVFF